MVGPIRRRASLAPAPAAAQVPVAAAPQRQAAKVQKPPAQVTLPAPAATPAAPLTPCLAGQSPTGEAWPILPAPAAPLGSKLIELTSHGGQTMAHNLGDASDASVLQTYNALAMGAGDMSEWATTAAATRFLVRCVELGQPVHLSRPAAILQHLELSAAHIALVKRLARACEIPPESLIFHGHPISAWRWPTPQHCTFSAARAVMQRLQAMPGMAEVKEQLAELHRSLECGLLLREMGEPWEVPSLHMEFLGGPGTGKTTVARLYAELLQALGVLRRGHCVEVGRDDLVAGIEGQTASKTRERLEAARGGVLFVDEAYALAGPNDAYGQESLATLVKFMEEQRHDMAVILAGYTNAMQQLHSANEGLRSRLGRTVVFRDLDATTLLQVLSHTAQQRGYDLSDAATAHLTKRLAAPLQGANGRDMRNLVDGAINRHTSRCRDATVLAAARGTALPRILSAEDFAPPVSPANQQRGRRAQTQLAGLVGLHPVKNAIRAFSAQLRMLPLRQAADLPVHPPAVHATFVGPPGTGKSTVARLYADILASCGLLPHGNVVEVRRGDLLGKYAGHTEAKTRAVLRGALGNVLVIEEAHTLVPSSGLQGDLGPVALQEIVTFMEQHRGGLAVILCGEATAMERIFSLHPTLDDSLGLQLQFTDWSSNDLTALLQRWLDADAYRLDARTSAAAIIDAAVQRGVLRHNARSVQTLLRQALQNQAVRLAEQADAPTPAELCMLHPRDFGLADGPLLSDSAAAPPADPP